jgi:hypothetical protein
VVHIKSGAGETSGPYRLSAVFEKKQDEWLWMQFHGSEPMKSTL